VAGAFLAATGAAPEHWVADVLHHVPLPHEIVPDWLTNVDYRLMAVIAGLTIIVGDTLWRGHFKKPATRQEATTDHSSISSRADNPSIAVLPFTNMSGDSEQEYFADGITEEIITGLSHVRWLFVIARNSTFTYRGKAVDVRQVARELGVRYVLEGSIRRSEANVRITAQMVEGQNGSHVWADRFDGQLENVFALQDEVTEDIVRAIAPTLRHAEMERSKRKPPADMHAYDYYLRALSSFYLMTREGNEATSRLLNKALIADSSFAAAMILQALVLGYASAQGWTQPYGSRHSEIVRLAHTAVSQDPNDPEVLAGAAHMVAYCGAEFDEATRLAERAQTLGPNSAFVWGQAGYALFHSGHNQKSVSSFERAIQLDPLDPFNYSTMGGLAYALIGLGEDQRAIEVATRAVHQNPNYAFAWRGLIAALALSDQLQQAREGVVTMLRVEPQFSIAALLARTPSAPVTFRRVIEGLRLAGVPDR
jgi:adenylate cyclase